MLSGVGAGVQALLGQLLPSISLAGGGASGSYAEAWLSAATVGASQIVTVGVGGAAGLIASDAGTGGTSSLGSLVSAPGGAGSTSLGYTSFPGTGLYVGGYPGQAAKGGNIVSMAGSAGSTGISINASTLAGHGANSPLGNGGVASSAQGAIAAPGSGFGSGAGGIANAPSQSGRPGASGAPGAVIIYEYA
jgi:hypothetical protein